MDHPLPELLKAIDRVQAIITFNLDGVIQDANANFLGLMGYRLDEVKGQHHAIFCEPGYVETPDYAQLWIDLHMGKLVSSQFKRLHKSGREVWLQSSYNPIVGADGVPVSVVKFATDITQTKEQSNQLESLARAIDHGLTVMEFDTDGDILYANQKMLDLLGYSLGELIGQSHSFLCTQEFLASDAYAQHWARLRAGESVQGEYQRVGKNGKALWLNATYNPVVDANGKTFKVIKFVTDQTAMKQVQADLEEARQRAENAAASKGSFLANMSHEIRTPMNAIIGFSDLLSQSVKEPTDLKYVNTIKTASRSLLTLINDILDTAKLERGAIELEQLNFSLRDLCAHVVDLEHILAFKKGIGLELVYPPGTTEQFRGDPFRIQQVLLNLLGNAIKFTDKGGVTLQVSQSDEMVSIAVKDTGIGIELARLASIFDSFTQADVTMTRKYGGTGLGTTIARQLVELMGGRIEVQSTLGRGSVFTVCLPLQPAELSTAPARSAAPPAPAAPLAAPLHVLVVDDVEANLDLAEILLKREGHTVARAADGVQALAAFGAGRFDVILMDLQMPGINGLEATAAIRDVERDMQRARTPIIALSANVMHAEKQRAFDAGMDGYVGKPIDLRQLRNEIARVLHALASSGTQEVDLLDKAARFVDIDHVNGVSVWGDRAVYDQQLTRFVQEVKASRKALNDALQQRDMAALKFLAHRMRGASGNLCLRRLHSVTGEVESSIDTLGRDGGKEAGIALFSAMDSLEKAFEAYMLTAPQTAAPQATPVMVDAATVTALIDKLLPLLAAGRLDDVLLDQLYGVLPATVARAVRDDINAFKFIKACKTLAEHKASLGTMS